MTPTTPAGLRKFDNLPAIEAVRRAWHEPAGNPNWHLAMKHRVREEMFPQGGVFFL